MNIRKFFVAAGLMLLAGMAVSAAPHKVKMSKDVLLDKIKGGWAGQTIGCTYGGPTEFRYKGCMIDDSIAINWPEHYVKNTMENSQGLYDDVYMDLTFVDVFQKEGLDAPIESFANAYAYADYYLWHANQQGRYNIKHGIMPPMSGHWLNNPHADDLDFQIEADYAGLMSPGMTGAACHYADGIGHIMNYGDGWYGGVYVAAMYSLAFVYDDIETVVKEALKVIPEESRYYKAMADVIRWHDENPSDWKACWQLAEDKWDVDYGCPAGVGNSFNIDAVINSVYILIGLLYGEEDFEKTMEISTRCGQDSDCNPASAAGILATMQGYSNIPEKFLTSLQEAEDINFMYTEYSLNKTYQMSYDQALQVIALNGGKVRKNKVKIKVDKPVPVRYEQSFEGIAPGEHTKVTMGKDGSASFEFDGCGVVVCGWLDRDMDGIDFGYVANVEVNCDGNVTVVEIPASFHNRQEQIWHNYQLEDGHHTVTMRCLNPYDKAVFAPTTYLPYVKK